MDRNNGGQGKGVQGKRQHGSGQHKNGRHENRFRQSRMLVPLALRGVTGGALACALAFAAMPTTVQAQAATIQTRSYGIAPGPLEDALNRFGREAGILLSFTTEATAGLYSNGLQGSHSVQGGLDVLLAGSGLRAVRQANGSYLLDKVPAPSPNAAGTTILPMVTVRATAQNEASTELQADGKAEEGYRASTVSSLGVLGSMSLQDTPFSISVVSRELIQNIQAQSPDDIYKINPSTRAIAPQIAGWTPSVSIRGFNTYDTAEDGLRRPYNHAAVLEDKERIEVLSGLSGFMYGAAAPAGIVNYVYKRPTMERLNSVTVGNYGGSQYYVHGDFGGRLDEAGRAGYRLNVVQQNGETAIDDQKIDRTLISAAIDWRLTDKLLLELNAVYNHYESQGPSAYWFFANGRGPAPDASKTWSQPWLRDEFENTKLTGKLTYQFSDQVTLRGAYTHSAIDRPVQDHAMNSGTRTGYRQLRQRAGQTKDDFDAAQALADIKFSTGGIQHTLTTGYQMYAAKSWGTTYAPHTGYQGPYAFAGPTHVPEAVFPVDTSSPYFADKAINQNIVLGDHIVFNEQWSVLAGLSHSRIESQSRDATGARTQPDYDKARNSPSMSLMYKPVPWLTTYASYTEGLEMGGIAPDTASNAGSIMPPMVSKQKELGIKADAGSMFLTAALFDIEKAYEYVDADNVYAQNGRQNHQGVEFTASGKLTRNLTLIGGMTLLDPKIKGDANDGKQPVNVARTLAKAYLEYALPVPGLVLTGGAYYTGAQWGNAANTDRLPAYTTVDLGLRYTTKVSERPLVLRLSVNNVADRNYWANAYYTGSPRSIALSAQYQF